MNMKAIKIFSIVGVLWSLTACGFMDCIDEERLRGSYEGTFQRFADGNPQGLAAVELTFEGGSFSGNSEDPKYPAICAGSYTTKRSSISFSNTCLFTADFDWTLILSGDFRIERDEEELILTKNDGNIVDMYRLVKK